MHRPIRVNDVQAKAPLWSVNLGCNFGLKLRDNSVLCFSLPSLKPEPEHKIDLSDAG